MNGQNRTKRQLSWFAMGACAALVFLGLHTSAHALSIRITDGMTTIDVADGDPGDIMSQSGAVGWNGTLGVFNLNLTVGQSNPIIGAVNAPALHLTSVHTSSAAGSLTVMLTDTDFTLPLAAGLDSFMSAIGGTTGGTVTSFKTYFDDSNTPFGTGTLLADLGSFAGPSFSGYSSTGLLPSSSPYSLTMIASISHSGISTTSVDAQLAAVPEPSTVLLLGSGLAGLAWWRHRKAHTVE